MVEKILHNPISNIIVNFECFAFQQMIAAIEAETSRVNTVRRQVEVPERDREVL
jgi:hypothetical protein